MKHLLVVLMLAVASSISLRAQIYEDSTMIQVYSMLPDTIKGRNLVVRHLNWARGVMDGIMDKFESDDLPNDSNYMVRPAEKLRISATVGVSGSAMVLKGGEDNDDGRTYISLPLYSQAMLSVGLSVHYRLVTAAFSFSPFRINGVKNPDRNFGLSIYNDKWGFDFVYNYSKSLRGSVTIANDNPESKTVLEYEWPVGRIRQRIISMHTYYAFNWKRFAMPAVFDQSWIQRRSVGSPLAGLSVQHVNMFNVLQDNETPENDDMRIRLWYVALGGGYGYNLAMPHHWLLHGSVMAEIVPYTWSRVKEGSDIRRFHYSWPPMLLTGRMGAVKYFNRYFVSIQSKGNYVCIGSKKNEQMHTVNWEAILSFGVRL